MHNHLLLHLLCIVSCRLASPSHDPRVHTNQWQLQIVHQTFTDLTLWTSSHKHTVPVEAWHIVHIDCIWCASGSILLSVSNKCADKGICPKSSHSDISRRVSLQCGPHLWLRAPALKQQRPKWHAMLYLQQTECLNHFSILSQVLTRAWLQPDLHRWLQTTPWCRYYDLHSLLYKLHPTPLRLLHVRTCLSVV